MTNFFAYISRTKYIDRWVLVHKIREENLQEHSFMVAMIAHALIVIRKEIFGIETDGGAVIASALFHDVIEIFTGDIPTPAKYFDEEFLHAHEQLEGRMKKNLLDLLPEELRGEYERAFGCSLSEGEKKIVKKADMLAAYIKCVEEVGMGNQDFVLIKNEIGEVIENDSDPALQYFFRECIPGFSKKLPCKI